MTTRRNFLKVLSITAAGSMLPTLQTRAAQKKQPNILWLSTEDISPHLGCYGYPDAHTPVLDNLASKGIKYTNACTVSGVCAPNRSTIITGVYANSLGTHHMRSGGEGVKVSHKPHLPDFMKCFSEYIREAGYYCTNNYKEDYNFITPDSAWDESSKEAHWQNRPGDDTPFFAVFNYQFTHEGSTRFSDERHSEVTSKLTPDQRQGDGFDLESFPPYYADTQLQRSQWAQYYELITGLDYWVGDHLKALEEAGLAEDTIVFFWSDHGVGMPRAKRWVYDSGTHIPLIVYIPGKYRINNQGQPGTVDDQLVSSVDFAPTVLNMLDLPVPDYMQGRAFLGRNLKPEREYVFAARDRMDERYDIIRTVRDKKYRYVRNYQPYKPYHQYMRSCENGPMMTELRKLSGDNELSPEAAQYFTQCKPLEELFDVENDPHQVNNLANDPDYADVKDRLWQAHLNWMREILDLGFISEPELFNIDQQHGHRYHFFRGPEGRALFDRLLNVASVAGRPDANDRLFLVDSLNDPEPSIRYWAAIGLGNLEKQALVFSEKLIGKLQDDSPVVRVAAARALCKQGNVEKGLPILIDELQSKAEWVRLASALVLDEIGSAARPAIPVLQKALEDKENKYVVRVANRVLNVLNSTKNKVR